MSKQDPRPLRLLREGEGEHDIQSTSTDEGKYGGVQGEESQRNRAQGPKGWEGVAMDHVDHLTINGTGVFRPGGRKDRYGR